MRAPETPLCHSAVMQEGFQGGLIHRRMNGVERKKFLEAGKLVSFIFGAGNWRTGFGARGTIDC